MVGGGCSHKMALGGCYFGADVLNRPNDKLGH